MSSVPTPNWSLRLADEPMMLASSNPPVQHPEFEFFDCHGITTLNQSASSSGDDGVLNIRERLAEVSDRVITTPPCEVLLLDRYKQYVVENNKLPAKCAALGLTLPRAWKVMKEPDLKGWVNWATGKGMVKAFENMKAASWACQNYLLDTAGIQTLMLECEALDFIEDPQNPSPPMPYPVTENSREILRVNMFILCATLIKRRYPGAIIRFWFGSHLLINYLKNNPAVQATLEAFGPAGVPSVVLSSKIGALFMAHLKATLPRVSSTRAQPPSQQGLGQHQFENDDLDFTRRPFNLNPTCRPIGQYPATQSLQSQPQWRSVSVADTNIYGREGNTVRDFIQQFPTDGSINFVILPQVNLEVHKGFSPNPTGWVPGRVRDYNVLSALPKTFVYPPTAPRFNYPPATILRPRQPNAVDQLAGDLKLRSEVEQLLRIIDSNRGGKTILVEFFTQDFGCVELLQSIQSPSPYVIFGAIHFNQKVDTGIIRESLVAFLKEYSLR